MLTVGPQETGRPPQMTMKCHRRYVRSRPKICGVSNKSGAESSRIDFDSLIRHDALPISTSSLCPAS